MATNTSLAKQEAAMANRAPAPAPKPPAPAPKPAVNTSIAKQDAAMAGRAPAPVQTSLQKQEAAMAARGADAAAARLDTGSSSGSSGSGATGGSGQGSGKGVSDVVDVPSDKGTKDQSRVVRTPVLDSNGKITGYTVTTYGPDGSILSTTFEKGTGASEEGTSDTTRDAFAALTDLFASYGLESLSGEIAGYMQQGLTASEALIKLKTNPNGAYAKRFAGNIARVKNGLNAISEAEYVNLENSYSDTLKRYGLGNMVSINRDDNYKKFADYISGDISADEFKDRIKTVVERVKNAEPSVKATLQSFYPEITDNDLISYFLNPKENLPKLQEKVTASEIGAAATGAGLGTNVTTATDLARYGVDQKMAREGYSTIAGVLPTADKLGNIYGETGVKYAQAEGEAEVFKGSQDAASKRRRLASMERAAFSGSAGTNQGSLTRSTQGRI